MGGSIPTTALVSFPALVQDVGLQEKDVMMDGTRMLPGPEASDRQ